MRPIQLLGPSVLLAGLLTLAVAVSRGEATLYLIVIIPAVVGSGPLAFLGILLVFAGFFLTFFLWTAGAPPLEAAPTDRSIMAAPGIPPEVPRPRRWGGVVFLGPIPLVFGSDPQMTRTMLILGAILFFVLLGLTLALFFY